MTDGDTVITAATLPRPDGASLVYDSLPGASPGIVFLHGLMSDRGGTKAEALMAHCRAKGTAFLRYDMYGHGASSGRFEDGTISRWAEDAAAVLDHLTQGPQIIVGSSMGGWIMLKLALARPDRMAGLVGIAPAPDFTQDLMWAEMSAAERETLMSTGMVEQPSAYGDQPYRISRTFIEDGRKNLLLRGPMDIRCPVRLLHGQNDPDVPWQISMKIADRISNGDVEITLLKDGDHRLSRPGDLKLLCETVDRLVAR